MSAIDLLITSNSAPAATTYVDDVFSAYTYSGNGATQTITNGIDLAGKGGLVWTKCRDDTYSHALVDTVRGNTSELSTNTSASTNPNTDWDAFTSSGYSLKAPLFNYFYNQNGRKYVSWTFREAAKFFDVVTYTGNASNRTIAHNLGQEVGMMLVKRTDAASDWQVYHRGLANTEYLVLNASTAKATGATRWNSTTPTTSTFSVGTDATVNASGGSYVAYLFAHDASTDGLIQCGSFTADGSGKASITLGWEPQFVIVKSSGNASGFYTIDSSRGFEASPSTKSKYMESDTTSLDANWGTVFEPTATGMNLTALTASTAHVYMAIRRSNKPPTSGTQIYNAIARTGTGAVANVTGVGFAPDFVLGKMRTGTLLSAFVVDKLRGNTANLIPSSTASELIYSDEVTAFTPDGVTLGKSTTAGRFNWAGDTLINWFFRRAVGFFDIVCYTGTGVVKTEAHNLGVVPEMLIVKSRTSGAYDWPVYHSGISASKTLYLNGTYAGSTDSSMWNNTAPTTSVFTLGLSPALNSSGATHVAYLFATKAGISKVGSYTGNGSTQNIDCGFAGGARFLLIKRTDAVGDWYVWDTARGIVAGNDPHLSLNTTAAEVTTDDSIDPLAAGFIVNQVAATNINVNAATYIFLAIA